MFLGESTLGPQSLCRETEGAQAGGDLLCYQREFPKGVGLVELSRPGCAHQAQLQVEPGWGLPVWWLPLAFICVCYLQPRPSVVSTGTELGRGRKEQRPGVGVGEVQEWGRRKFAQRG